MYVLVPLHRGQGAWLQRVRAAVASATRQAQLGRRLVKWLPEADVVPADQAVAVHLASAPPAPDLEEEIRRCLARGIRVVPVLPAGVRVTDVLTDELRLVNAVRWEATGEEVARVLLDALGIIEHERKVFISYRRTEGDWIANQLWDRLTRARFDVFLDRFSVPPAENFQETLNVELADKAFVVVIESATTARSLWVQHEVTFALSHQVGLLALTLPSVPELDRYFVIDDAFRIVLSSGDLRGMRRATLRKAALDRVFAHIQREHARLLRRRRAQLLGSARDFAREAGWTSREVAEWSLLLERASTEQALLEVTPRAPRPQDLWRLDLLKESLVKNQALDPRAPAHLVHYGALPEVQERLLDWMGSLRGLDTVDLLALPALLSVPPSSQGIP